MYLKHRPEKYKVQSEIIKGEKKINNHVRFSISISRNKIKGQKYQFFPSLAIL